MWLWALLIGRGGWGVFSQVLIVNLWWIRESHFVDSAYSNRLRYPVLAFSALSAWKGGVQALCKAVLWLL